MKPLSAFVLSCLDDDEADHVRVHDQAEHAAAADRGDTCPCPWPGIIAADVVVKRRLVEAHDGEHTCPALVADEQAGDATIERWGSMPFGADEVCPTLRMIAQPYVDRIGWIDQ